MRRITLTITLLFLTLVVIIGCKRGSRDIEVGGTGDLLALHNHERESRGLQKLDRDPLLDQRAQEWAIHMAERDSLTHSKLDIKNTNYRMMGENIAMGYPDEKSVMKGWMNSSGHKRNILNPKFNRIGYGKAKRSDGSNYWCVQFGTVGEQ